ncbi:MAG: twin-arginine translocase TatA/TatE family subunit [Candidatus Omnitrophota bacterium]
MGHFGLAEILVVALVIVLLFGAGKIPAMFRAMGEGVKEFKKGHRDGTREEDHPDQKSTR